MADKKRAAEAKRLSDALAYIAKLPEVYVCDPAAAAVSEVNALRAQLEAAARERDTYRAEARLDCGALRDRLAEVTLECEALRRMHKGATDGIDVWKGRAEESERAQDEARKFLLENYSDAFDEASLFEIVEAVQTDWRLRGNTIDQLRSDLAAALKVVEAARPFVKWIVGDSYRFAFREALAAFDDRKQNSGDSGHGSGNASAESPVSSQDTPEPAGGSLPGLVDAAIERVAAACERADANAHTPWPWPLTRLAQVLREELRKGDER